MADTPTATIGIIGGSGLYQIDGFEKEQEIEMETPFGSPSDKLILGTFHGVRVVFLPRHGVSHRLLPCELPHRANIWALKSLGVQWILSVSAVGSLQAEYPPGTVVCIDQFIDRTKGRHEPDTFFGEGIVAHCSFDQPISLELRDVLFAAAQACDVPSHCGGAYVNIQGPTFSTLAESQWYHRQGFEVVGMTNMAEARLAREAEIAYATMALVTDFDSWHPDHDSVTVEAVIACLKQNTANAQRILATALPEVANLTDAKAHSSLKFAIMTARDHWPEATIAKLQPIIEKYV